MSVVSLKFEICSAITQREAVTPPIVLNPLLKIGRSKSDSLLLPTVIGKHTHGAMNLDDDV